jgi:hypothetical protein
MRKQSVIRVRSAHRRIKQARKKIPLGTLKTHHAFVSSMTPPDRRRPHTIALAQIEAGKIDIREKKPQHV